MYRECVESFLKNQKDAYIAGKITDKDYDETLEAFKSFVHSKEREENNVHQA